jgi:hypothetical protein
MVSATDGPNRKAGQVAAALGLPAAHLLAALSALIGIPRRGERSYKPLLLSTLRRRYTGRLRRSSSRISSRMRDRWLMIEYVVQLTDHGAFVEAMDAVANARRRDGAYAWGLYENTAKPGHLAETFLTESWVEHLRQRERVTKADEVLQERVGHYLLAPPVATHLVNANASADA